MKILALSPFDPDGVTGNTATLRRLQAGLRARGHGFDILSVASPEGDAGVREGVEKAAPDLLHFYHAYKTGRLVPLLGRRPAVVTISGTDLNQDFQDASKRPAIEIALGRAARIVTYNVSLADRLRELLPLLSPKLRVLPKGVTIGDVPFDLRAEAQVPPGRAIFLHAGGIRPVKDNLFAIDALASLREEVTLVFAGPVLDEAYGAELLRRLAREPWVRYLPLIPPAAMGSAFRGSDVVLNTSQSEGMSNALMEAMAVGGAILAADIPGNRDLLQDGETGLLYRDRMDFGVKARRLLTDPDLRRSLGAAAGRRAAAAFSTERELDALLEAYTAALFARS